MAVNAVPVAACSLQTDPTMPDRESALRKARRRLERWEEKYRRLREAPMRKTGTGKRMYDQYTQEVTDRLERARVKFEKLRRLGNDRFDDVMNEFDRALAELQDAWDMTVAKIAWSDPYGGG